MLHYESSGRISTYHDNRRSFGQRIKDACARLGGDYMLQSGGHWMLLMVAEDDDLILLKMLLGFTDEDYRGKGDWYRKQYHNAADNRI